MMGARKLQGASSFPPFLPPFFPPSLCSTFLLTPSRLPTRRGQEARDDPRVRWGINDSIFRRERVQTPFPSSSALRSQRIAATDALRPRVVSTVLRRLSFVDSIRFLVLIFCCSPRSSLRSVDSGTTRGFGKAAVQIGLDERDQTEVPPLRPPRQSTAPPSLAPSTSARYFPFLSLLQSRRITHTLATLSAPSSRARLSSLPSSSSSDNVGTPSPSSSRARPPHSRRDPRQPPPTTSFCARGPAAIDVRAALVVFESGGTAEDESERWRGACWFVLSLPHSAALWELIVMQLCSLGRRVPVPYL